MGKKLPTTSMLEAFNAVMAEGGFLKASKLLNLSPSAISYTIKSLENVLGAQLFERRPDGIVPTRLATYLIGDTRLIVQNLDHLVQKTANLSGKEQTVRILTSQTIASLLLLPRMGALIDAFPGWHFEVVSWIGGNNSLSDHGISGIDVEIRWTDLGPPHTAIETYELASDFALPVCSPSYLKFLGGELTAKSAALATAFHALNWPECWPRWIEHTFGGEGITFRDNINLQTTSLSVQAAQSGFGIAMAHGPLIQRDLQEGSLVLASPTALPIKEAYIAIRYREAASKIFSDLVAWLRRNTALKL